MIGMLAVMSWLVWGASGSMSDWEGEGREKEVRERERERQRERESERERGKVQVRQRLYRHAAYESLIHIR